ncbi:PD-(D/E)XK nuclease family protein [Tenacibaculum maritimum]|uniref:PD-(D/E)XK nuclease family protein n=1 Tax=Tenacibaculum maritimum TaxID=107401 RepID=UPI0010A4C6FA|nr:PD-(D/E)XK nuclease family protein [Tenacibaculum maritimum]QCD61108.1 hypothetical protein B9C57_00390 [Tenacibaculum maritimum]
MINELFNLYKNNSNKTPLEDFNTECFAGILKLYEEIKVAFTNFLELPNDNYKVVTQLKKDLKEYTNCIIDFALIGEENVCFIENKVESKEGVEQLLRYGRVLDLYYTDKKKYLFYCTKYSEPKNLDREYEAYNFKQFKWFEIANFLKPYAAEYKLINNYIEFLKRFNMQQDNTLKINNLLALENLNKSIEIIEFHIENSKDEFNNRFYPKNYDRNFNWKQLKENNRFCHLNEFVLKSESNKYSEILYSIQFETLQLNAQIYLNSDHEQYQLFNNIDINNTDFNLVKYEYGSCIYKTKNLADFLNDENSDKTIKEWFTKSFDELLEIIKSNNELNWNIK